MHRMQIVTVKSWPLDFLSTAEMKPRCVRYKNASNAWHWIAIEHFKCASFGLISAVITPLDQWLRIK